MTYANAKQLIGRPMVSEKGTLAHVVDVWKTVSGDFMALMSCGYLVTLSDLDKWKVTNDIRPAAV